MKKFSKKAAALLLVAVMMVSLFPTSVFAEDIGVADPEIPVTSEVITETETEEETTLAEETTAEETTAEETTAEETTTEETKVVEPTTEEAKAVEPTTEEVKAVEPTTEEVKAVEPTTEEAKAVETPAQKVEETPAEANAITSQPQDAIVAPYGKAEFSVGVNGAVKSYQWQYSKNGRYWYNLSKLLYNGAKINVIGSNWGWNANNGYQYRCVVTFKDNNKINSEAATLYVASAKTVSAATEDAKIDVSYPAGTFPDGTDVFVTDVDENTKENTTAAINLKLAEDGNEKVKEITAVDISFDYNGDEWEPANENEVTVTLESDAVKEGARIFHINDDGTAEEIKNVEIQNNVAKFSNNAFSVYAIVWTVDGEEKVATIHYGTMSNGEFSEFTDEKVVTLDESADSVDIAVGFSGYFYSRTVYCATEETSINDGVEIGSQLVKNSEYESGWEYTEYSTDYSTNVTSASTKAVTAGSHIYVIYQTAIVLRAGSSTPATNNDLGLIKTVTPNGDGTYKISLSITGKVNQESQTITSSANVIVVLDVSTSMDETLSGGTTRLAAVKSAANTLVDAMPNAAKVEMAVVSFGGSVSTDVNWTTIASDATKTSIKSTINGLSTNRGTNWTSAMSTAKTLADNKQNSGDTDPTYIIFLTDGCPTTNSGNNHSHGSNGVRYVNDTCISDPLATMTAMVTAGYQIYGIYANTTSDSTIPRSGGQQNGSDWSGGTNLSFTDPLQYVISTSGAGAISGDDSHYFQASSASALNDVFTALAQTITSNLAYSDAQIDDGVTDMSNTSASTAVSGEASGFTYTKGGATWEDAPEAKVENGSVIWDLSEIGDLENGVTYTVSFDIWPSQEAYDLLADINNAIVRADDGTITTYDSADDAYAALSSDVKEQIYKDTDGIYKLKTNTHLTNSYTYNGNTYTYTPNELTNGSMALASKSITLEKVWPKNMLDRYGAAVYRDENGDEHTATEITLTLTQDDNDYLDVTVGQANEWKSGDIYISCGLMTVSDGTVTIKEEGYDYTVTEPAAFSYYWDLISPVYHPMVINGTATVLVLDETATAADVENGVYQIGDNFYRTDNSSEELTLQASNYRRSNLNLTKVAEYNGNPVTGGGEDDYFTFKVNVKDANSSDEYVWFSAWDPEANATVKASDWVISGATAEAGDTGYWYADNGADVTFKIKAGWNVRFLNLYHGSTFSFEETGMPTDYEFKTITANTQYEFMQDYNADWYEVAGKVTTGTITEPNNSYTVNYDNECNAFYVYHSGVDGDGNLEVIKMPAEGDTYDLTQNLTENTLYGGYYLDYAGKGSYKDDGKAADDGVAYTGMNYQWSDAQTVKGTEMTPVAGETYYIKEVPTYYLRNYHQINFVKSTGELKALYLLSAVDDLNYSSTGYILSGTEQAANVASSMSFKNWATNKTITLKANTIFSSLGIKGEGSENNYLTYYDLTGTDYFAVGEFTVLPYWETLDGIKVTGISTRTITITKLYKAGVTKTDK